MKELFAQMAASEYRSFVDPDHAGVIKGSNASMVILNASGKLVTMFNGRGAYERDFEAAWEKLGLSPGRFPAKSTYTFPAVKETATSKGPGGGDFAYVAKATGPAFRFFLTPGEASRSVVVESRPATAEQREALAWSSEQREIEARVFRNLLDTINPGGVARAADVVIPWQEITGSLRYMPAEPDDRFRYAVIAGPIRMTKKRGAFRAEGSLRLVVCYRKDRAEIHALRGAINVGYVGGGTATPDRPLRFSINWMMTPEPEDIPVAFRIPLERRL